jgi:hypothetical protein
MREERSSMAASIAPGVGEGVLSGRMAWASRARRVGRRVGEMCGRAGAVVLLVGGVLDVEESVGLEMEDGDDSGSKRAERMAESLGVSCEVGI